MRDTLGVDERYAIHGVDNVIWHISYEALRVVLIKHAKWKDSVVLAATEAASSNIRRDSLQRWEFLLLNGCSKCEEAVLPGQCMDLE